MAEIQWAPSADKHGVSREDAIHAMLNAYVVVESFDQSRVGGQAPDLFVGPQRALGAPLIEVMTVRLDGVLWVFHVMEAKPSRLKLANEAMGWS
jgi:hypothetical protein